MTECVAPVFYLSNRGKKKVAFKGYDYSRDKEINNKIYWKCSNRSCSGRLITLNDEIMKETEHNLHGPNKAETEIKLSMARIRESASSTTEAPARIVNKELQSNLPSGVQGYWPQAGTVKRRIQRERRKYLPALPQSLKEVELKEEWKKTSSGEEWIMKDMLIGETETDRIIIFCTEQNFRYLCRSPSWYGDGTFSIAPRHFFQMYTLHGMVLGQIVPLMFCLLTKKSKDTYEFMFKVIKDTAHERRLTLMVESFRVDFDISVVQAIRNVLSINPLCCLFHLAQAHWRKLQELGHRTLYIENHDFALQCKMFTALAFLPPDVIKDAFVTLKENASGPIENFVAYIEENYIGHHVYTSRAKPDGTLVFARKWSEARFPPGIWSVYTRVMSDEPRTNNDLEGWHRRFNSIVAKHHPNIFEFIERLRGEQAYTETLVEQLVAGQGPRRKQQKVQKQNDRIKRIVTSYDDGQRDTVEYLRGIAYNITY